MGSAGHQMQVTYLYGCEQPQELPPTLCYQIAEGWTLRWVCEDAGCSHTNERIRARLLFAQSCKRHGRIQPCQQRQNT
jgi:hypothetical protein